MQEIPETFVNGQYHARVDLLCPTLIGWMNLIYPPPNVVVTPAPVTFGLSQ